MLACELLLCFKVDWQGCQAQVVLSAGSQPLHLMPHALLVMLCEIAQTLVPGMRLLFWRMR